MRIYNFNAYSKNTPNVMTRAPAPYQRKRACDEQRQIDTVHHRIGNSKTKCTSSQLDTVSNPDLASQSTLNIAAFNRKKNGQNTANNRCPPTQHENK